MVKTALLVICHNLFSLSTSHKIKICLLHEIVDKKAATNSTLFFISTDCVPSRAVIIRRLSALKQRKTKKKITYVCV